LPSSEDFQYYNAQVSLRNNLKDEWIGLTWATKVSDNISVGLSGFWSIYEFDGKSELLYAALDANNRSVSYFNDVSYNQKTYGLFFKAGASWISEDVSVGLNVHLPYINLWDKASFEYDEVLAGLDPEDDLFTFISYDDLSNSRKTALGISLGSGIKIGKSEVHLNLEWYQSINKYRRIALPNSDGDVLEAFDINFNEELRSVVNFGVGGEVYVSPTITGFASFSSDFSAFKSSANLFDIINPYDDEINELTDYWHVALGLDLKFKWGDIILGSSYSGAGTRFAQPIAIPVGDLNGNGDQVSYLKLRRTRYIIGIEIPLLREKIDAVIKKQLR
jgi:hypothetical protein